MDTQVRPIFPTMVQRMRDIQLALTQPQPFTFYLGTHMPNWLGKTEVPLFISARRLRRGLPGELLPAASWALDSGGFSELSMFGRWQTTPQQYAQETERWGNLLGGMRWAAIQDWMCEPFILAKTGLTIYEHQVRTIDNYLNLVAINPELPWIPIIQGWDKSSYHEHIRMYKANGIHLDKAPVVGVGTMCRRQGTTEAETILHSIYDEGIKIHGFGFKITGLQKAVKYMVSADSMAWSYDARRAAPLPGCKGHKNCANCISYAMKWRDKVIDQCKRI